MTSITKHAGPGRHGPKQGRRLATFLLTASIAAGAATRVGAQQEPPMRMWAAQTGPNLVTLSWEEVPGAVEYRIWAGDPDAATTPAARRPISTVSGSGRYARITGIGRVAGGLYLEAIGADRRRRRKVAFNPITAVRGTQTVTAPAEATATVTGPEEITLSWTPVPGATAYVIGRAVSPNGLQMLCRLCPTQAAYVDRDITSGARHRYTVSAVFPNGLSQRTASNIVTPGVVADAPPTQTPTTGSPPPGQPAGTTGPTTTTPDTAPPPVNPQIPATAPDSTPPPIGPPPSGAESLVTPADTGSCVAARAEPDSSAADSIGRIDTRADRIESRTTTNPDANTANSWLGVTTTNLGSADYRQGKCLNLGATGYPDLWDPIAAASGMTSAERVAAWKEIGIVALAYKHILARAPTPEETRRDVAALKAGTAWHQLWRQLAHSAERDTRFGYWAPAPIPDSLEAQRDFGLAVPPWTAQQCYGGLGPKCGGLPEAVNAINDKVYAYWFGAFRMPDNTEFAYIEMGVAVGSILHDNACLKDKGGLNCNGLGLGDLVKIGPLWAAGLEWNKAAWNLIDGRTWRARFGPYPTNLAFRDRFWYDDLRPATPRAAMMAQAISMFTWPGLTETYTGGETRRSRALLAPAGTSLDATDVAFCGTGMFGSTGSFIGKAPWGVCEAGASTPGPHTASPPTTGTPATGTPTTGTATPSASCKLDYRRADNMWAAFGRPDGFLGIESITLAPAEHKVFITDWKYEKQRTDGTTYYGSHLRMATNASSRPVRLQLISGAGAVTSTVRLDPNTTKEFQADLRDVYCEP
jgi:hypothetical protein